jgi:N-acetylglucosamine malate deacetylase 1
MECGSSLPLSTAVTAAASRRTPKKPGTRTPELCETRRNAFCENAHFPRDSSRWGGTLEQRSTVVSVPRQKAAIDFQLKFGAVLMVLSPSVVSRIKILICSCLALVAATLTGSRAGGQENAPKEPMRIIVFGAHPDDCELEAAGTAARWAKLGYKVKFVSVTNGDIGHHQLAGAILARRRTDEVKKCAQILGIETEVLDIHDGELLPTLENRRTITREIREWKADVVIAPRPNDYHPDHRYTGILVQDAAFMVIVPSFCPDVPALRKNPVFLYTEDDFKKPNPFSPDVVVPIDPVFDLKVACIDALESQFYEWNPWLFGYLDQVPKERAARLEWTRDRAARRYGGLADRFRPKLIELLGEEKGKAVKYAESFEICEYGSQPTRDQLMRIFPFFDPK